MTPEEAERIRLYFQKSIEEQSKRIPEILAAFEKIDHQIDAEQERFFLMLRPPGTGRN